jgi:hypothetical protein
LIAKSLFMTPINTPKIIDVEFTACDISDFNSGSKVRIILVYRPPDCSSEITLTLCEILSELVAVPYPSLVLGDFNLPNISWDEPDLMKMNKPCKIFFSCFKDINFTQMIHEKTRDKNILDLILTNEPNLVSNLEIGPPFSDECDHNVVTFDYKFALALAPLTFARNFFKANYNALNLFFNSINWNEIFVIIRNLDETYEKFINLLNLGILCFVPLTPVRSHSSQFPKHILKLLEYRKKLWPNTIYPSVKLKFDACNKKIDFEMTRYFANREKKLCMRDQRSIFQYVGSFLKSKHMIIPTLIDADKNVFSDIEKAEVLAKFFVSVFNKTEEFTPEIKTLNKDQLRLLMVTKNYVYEILKQLKPKNNTSPDKIPNIFLKMCSTSLCSPLAKLFNLSLITGKFPQQWLHAIVIPLPKPGNPNLIENYRPISLTSSMSKLMEKIIYKELFKFFEENNLIPDCQHGFRPNKSVTTQLVETYDDWTNALENKKNIDVIFFDVKKAFDRLPHPVLLKKLQNAGVDGNILQILHSFLNNRTFSVKIGMSLSNPQIITSGVPQGTLLGPLLFNFFVADLPKTCAIDGISIKLFADDIKSYQMFDYFYETIKMVEFVKLLNFWCKINGLTLSETKCEVMHLGKNNPQRPYSLNHRILPVAEDIVRDLGIYVNPSLKWSDHISLICSKANSRLYLLFKCLRSSDYKFLTKMYSTYVRPLLESSSIIFNPHLRKDIDKIERIQRKATRTIFARCFKIKYFDMPSYEERLTRLGLKPLEFRRLVADLVLFYKIVNKTVNLNLRSNFAWVRRRGRGSKFRLNFSQSFNSHRKHFFFQRTGRLFIKLPDDIQNAPTVGIFKNALFKLDLIELSRSI